MIVDSIIHLGTIMVDVIRNFQYKTAGRGRGVLGLKDLRPCRRPGEASEKSTEETRAESSKGGGKLDLGVHS